MTATIETPAVFIVGQELTQRADFVTLPVGSVIRYDSDTYEKVGPDRWLERGINLHHSDGWFSLSGNYLVSIGTPTEPETPAPAEPAASETVHIVNEGPREYAADETGPASIMSLHRFKQRFRTGIRASIARAGVNVRAGTSAFQALDVPAFDLTPGMFIQYGDPDFQRLPDGTIIETVQQNVWMASGVWGVRNGGWHRLTGGAALDCSFLCRIVSIPGVEAAAWVHETATEEDLPAMTQFQADAWQRGREAKERNSWCGELEASMYRSGIVQPERFDRGPALTPEEVAALPVSSVLRYIAPTGDTVLYVRDDAARNPARTRRLAGTLPGDWTRLGMKALTRGAARLRIQVVNGAEIDALPVGSVISDGPTHYTMQEDGWSAGDRHYRYNGGQLSNYSMHITEVPGR